MGNEADMAKFAQVGVSTTSSQAGASHQGSAFDPLYSQQYSQAVQPQVTDQAASEALYSEAFPQEPQMQEPTRYQVPNSRPTVATRITRVEPVYAQEQEEAYEQAPSAYAWTTGDEQNGMDDHDDAGGVYPPMSHGRPELNRFAALGCAVASLALVAGIGVWGYNLIMRDVSGVPVVRAVEGPLRVVPENPGGTLADHQGLAVNEIAANGTAADPADTLRLAPAAINLTDEDQPVPTLLKNKEIATALDTLVIDPLTETPPAVSVQNNAPDTVAGVFEQRENDIDALVASLTTDATSLTDVALTSAVFHVETETAVTQSAPVGRTITAPRPKSRPAGYSTTTNIQSGTRSRIAPSAVTEVDIASLETGTRLAQLGAYESPEIARQQWSRISGQFGDFFVGKQRVVQRAESGGRVFYRLRVVGFEDLSATRRFCSALVAGNADCIPVAIR